MTKREKQRKYAEHVQRARAYEAVARAERKAARKLEADVMASLQGKRA